MSAADLILPIQFHPTRARSPEGRLMLAILEDAVGIYAKYGRMPGRGRWRRFTEAEGWLFSDDTGWPFSMVNICDTLGIDIAWFRKQLVLRTPPGRDHAAHVALSVPAQIPSAAAART
jgi:hypothetical protein